MAYKILSFAMAPLLLTQGYFVRKNTLELPEAEGERTGIAGCGEKKLRLMVLGDSAAAGVGVANQSQALTGQILKNLTPQFNTHWQLIAASGASTEATISTLTELPAKEFDIVMISLGVNDVTANTSMRRCQKHQQALVALLKEKFAAKSIIFSAVPPMHLMPALPQPLRWYLGARAKRLNEKLSQWLARQNNCFLLQAREERNPELIAEDGFHPGEKYYAWWGQQAAKLIQQQAAEMTIQP